MTPEEKNGLINFLGSFISDTRRDSIEQKLDFRTRFVTVVLEDIYNSHNASAVIRSCECFGIQDLHVVEERNEYQLNPGVTRGSSKWIDLYRYRDPDIKNIKVCYAELKSRGYHILATTSDPVARPIKEYDVHEPVALTFGTELDGLSEFARENADDFVHIPMLGFTESFNISVSAALCLYEIRDKLQNSDLNWHLDETQKLDLRLDWYRKTVNRPKDLEREFFKLNKR